MDRCIVREYGDPAIFGVRVPQEIHVAFRVGLVVEPAVEGTVAQRPNRVEPLAGGAAGDIASASLWYQSFCTFQPGIRDALSPARIL